MVAVRVEEAGRGESGRSGGLLLTECRLSSVTSASGDRPSGDRERDGGAAAADGSCGRVVIAATTLDLKNASKGVNKEIQSAGTH